MFGTKRTERPNMSTSSWRSNYVSCLRREYQKRRVDSLSMSWFDRSMVINYLVHTQRPSRWDQGFFKMRATFGNCWPD